jgi:hypothetical protein
LAAVVERGTLRGGSNRNGLIQPEKHGISPALLPRSITRIADHPSSKSADRRIPDQKYLLNPRVFTVTTQWGSDELIADDIADPFDEPIRWRPKKGC